MINHYKPYKKDFDYSYALGVFLTIELLSHKPEKMLCVVLSSQAERNSGAEKIVSLAKLNNIPVEINDRLIERISPKENCYAVGIFRKYEPQINEGENHLVLVNPMDSGNLGTIIRTSLGFGIRNLAIIRPAVDIFDPKTIRSSMGAIFTIGFSYFESFEAYQSHCHGHHLYPFLLGGKHSIHACSNIKKEPFSLIFGNESSGLPEAFNDIGTGIHIPHASAIDSLNLSIAVGIAAYEFTKDMFNPQ